MNEEGRFRDDRAMRLGVLAICACLGYMMILVGFYWNGLPPEVPLFYSLPWGEEWLIPKLGLTALIGSMAVLGVVNTLWAYRLYRTENLLSTYLVYGSVTILLLMAINLTKIIGVLI